MMSTSLLERQESNGIGQRGQGSQSYPPVGGVRRTPMFRKTQQIHLVGIGGIGDERYRRGAVDAGIQSDGLGSAGLRYDAEIGRTRRAHLCRPSGIECGGGPSRGHLLRRVGTESRGRGGQGEADSRDSSCRDAGGADAAEIRGRHCRRSRQDHDDVDGGQCAGPGRVGSDDGDRRQSECAGESCPAWPRRSPRGGSR